VGVCECVHVPSHAGVCACVHQFALVITDVDLMMTYFQAVPTSKGQALADEYGIKFFETVSKICCLCSTYSTSWICLSFFLC
jgi:hypothetical protein